MWREREREREFAFFIVFSANLNYALSVCVPVCLREFGKREREEVDC